MLLRKAASDRNRFAVSQHEAGERYRDEGRDVGCMNFRDRDLGHGEYGSSNNDKHRRSAGKQPCKKDQGCENERRNMRFVERPDDVADALEWRGRCSGRQC